MRFIPRCCAKDSLSVVRSRWSDLTMTLQNLRIQVIETCRPSGRRFVFGLPRRSPSDPRAMARAGRPLADGVGLVTSALFPTYARADLAFERGEGAWLFAANGDRYLDFGGGVAVNSLGHAHPRLVATLRAAAEKPWHVSNLFQIPQAERLARRLVDATFADRVFFSNSSPKRSNARSRPRENSTRHARRRYPHHFSLSLTSTRRARPFGNRSAFAEPATPAVMDTQSNSREKNRTTVVHRRRHKRYSLE